MTLKTLLCEIYRSVKYEGMYLYVAKTKGLELVPQDLLDRFGRPELAMTLMLTDKKVLARANVQEVMEKIDGQGFYLQMPPGPKSGPDKE